MKENDYGVVEFYFIPELLEKCIEMYSDIALIIISPDYVYLKKDTLQRIVKLAKENDILLCCDDVKQGYRYRKGTSLELVTDEKADLYTFAKGLANETKSQLYRAFDFKYITQEQFNHLSEQVVILIAGIKSLSDYLIKSDFKGNKFKKDENKQNS